MWFSNVTNAAVLVTQFEREEWVQLYRSSDGQPFAFCHVRNWLEGIHEWDSNS